MIEAPFSPSTASRPLGRAPASMHAGLGPAVLVRRRDGMTLTAAINYAHSLHSLRRFDEAKSLLRKMVPVARRVVGEGHELTLKMRKIYAEALYRSLYSDAGATLDDLREAVSTLAEIEQTARRVLGGAHPLTQRIERETRNARAVLTEVCEETPPPPPKNAA